MSDARRPLTAAELAGNVAFAGLLVASVPLVIAFVALCEGPATARVAAREFYAVARAVVGEVLRG